MTIFETMVKWVFAKVSYAFLLLFLFNGLTIHAQTKCGFDRVISNVIQSTPAFADSIAHIRAGHNLPARAANKTTSDDVIIPVVFHIVLNTAQLNTIGNEAGIIRRIDSQLAVVNRDFKALNTDISAIPEGFKKLRGGTNISFGLAHTAPDGSATSGYQIITTKKNGIEVDGGWGTGFGFSEAKYTVGGGADAWDPESYINIWVINTLENSRQSNILGLAIPPYLTKEDSRLPVKERGITLHYGAFGKRTYATDVFIMSSDGGRTLTHELGHFFGMFHIWGDDDGKCPNNGGNDDGISDTPPQSYASSGCAVAPKYDACSKTGDGIMFMNFMDYSNDACAVMYTTEQATRMNMYIQPGADAYGLTQHPWLLSYPDSSRPIEENDYIVYPNPAKDILSIVFKKPSKGLKSIHLLDIMGRFIEGKEYTTQAGFYTFDVGALAAGMYLLVLDFDKGKEVEKVIIR
jgi:hypothetical protein